MKSFIIALTFVSLNSLAGVNSSGGGGGGTFKLASGYTPNKYNISILSKQDGALKTILKYYVLAGAEKNSSTSGDWYELKDTDSVIMLSEEMQVLPNEKKEKQLQMNLQIKFEDIYDIGSSSKSTNFTFKGPLAAALHAAMEKSGLKPNSHSIGADGEIYGAAYHDDSLFCEKRPEDGLRGGISCSLLMLEE